MSMAQDTQATIRPLVAGIAENLGEQWTVEDGREGVNGLTLTDGEVTLFAHTSYVSNGKRLHVTGAFPDGWIDVYGMPGDTRAESTIALSRDPKAAAKQLSKLVESTREQTAYVVAELAKDARALAARRDFLESLRPFGAKEARMWGRDDAKANSARITIGNVYGDLNLRYAADGGDLDLHGLSVEQITAILAFVKANTDALSV
jgi:hypothetical protein